jgi:hypothetical protein
MKLSNAKFPLGQCVATPGALDALARAGVMADVLLHRHESGDWGEVDAEDQRQNDSAVVSGARVHSAYRLPDTMEKIWIITEWDRSITTILLPDEY